MTGSPAAKIERLLADRIGLDPSSLGSGAIDRGVRARMLALDAATLDDYAWIIEHSGTELQALIEEIVIPESWFFRDDRPFAELARLAVDGWVARPDRPPLAILSLPCAGGEEAYSIAITLLEADLPTSRFRVEGVDVSERAIARAVAGTYTANAFRGSDPLARPRSIQRAGAGFAMTAAVRESVRFRTGNLLDPGLFADRAPFDAVFCRNLLIYFDPPSRARAFANLDRLVAPGGLLVLGHADRPDLAHGSAFAPVADRRSFAYRKGSRPERAGPASTRPVAPPRPRSAGATAANLGEGRLKPIPQVAPPTPPPAPARPPTPPTPPPAAADPLALAFELADGGRYAEAARQVAEAMRQAGPTAPSCYLAGLIDEALGRHREAEGWFTKAVYLDGQHDEALLALAALAKRRGDVAAEAGYRRRADRIVARRRASR